MSHIIAFLSVCLAQAVVGQAADLVLHNGKIVTLEDRIGEAQAVAVRDGKIVAVGTNDEVRKHIRPNTRVIDLKGRLAIPGFIEGHGHFTGIGA